MYFATIVNPRITSDPFTSADTDWPMFSTVELMTSSFASSKSNLRHQMKNPVNPETKDKLKQYAIQANARCSIPNSISSSDTNN